MQQASQAPRSFSIHEQVAAEEEEATLRGMSGSLSAAEGEDIGVDSDAEDDSGPIGLQCLPHLSRRVCMFPPHNLNGTWPLTLGSYPHVHVPCTDRSVCVLQTHKMLVLVLTFMAYAAFHASRKPLSIVKSVLIGDLGLDHHHAAAWPFFDAGAAPLMSTHASWAHSRGLNVSMHACGPACCALCVSGCSPSSIARRLPGGH